MSEELPQRPADPKQRNGPRDEGRWAQAAHLSGVLNYVTPTISAPNNVHPGGPVERVKAYVDGFNLYHGLKARHGRKHLWLDLRGLLERQPHCDVFQATDDP